MRASGVSVNGRSPLSADAARAILDYDRAVFGRFEAKVRRLPRKVATADRGIGHASHFGTLVHILNVRDAWFNFVLRDGAQGADAFFGRPERRPDDWRGFDRYAPEVWEGHDRVRSQCSEAFVKRRVQAPWMPGRYTVGDAVLQVSYEQAHHLGEIIGALWTENRRPPEMTWIDVGRGDGPRKAR